MQNVEKVKGFNKLDKQKQNMFKRVHEKHLEVLENKEPWTPTSVKWDKQKQCFIVTFVNGDWLHYTVGGYWY